MHVGRLLALLATVGAISLLFASPPLLAWIGRSRISQYAHTAWTVRDGFSLGNVYAMAQTPDGYLWLGTEFGLVSLRWRSLSPLATTCGSAAPR
jgi:ligand-binding sensor domain-containing protein